jgi:hypothetical protein
MTGSIEQKPPAGDRFQTALALALSAFFLGCALDAGNGSYSKSALAWLTISLLCCGGALAMPAVDRLELLARRSLKSIFVLAILFQILLLLDLPREEANPAAMTGLILIAGLGFLLAFITRRLLWPLFLIMIVAFVSVVTVQFRTTDFPGIDLFYFQQQAADVLVHGHVIFWYGEDEGAHPRQHGLPAIVHGHNPYAMRYHNMYDPSTVFYGPGVVDEHQNLTQGFPYPPLSLLMVLPSCYFTGDCRYVDVVSIGLSALLMAAARPGRWGVLAATLFLLTPKVLRLVDLAWTEPLLTLNFSLAMFCACRCRKMLPWALGLYFACKQYTVLTLPALWLLTDGPDRWKQLAWMCLKAGLVVAVVTLPFFFWNPYEFNRAVVLWQFVQPFRQDALSYLVLMYRHNGGQIPPLWTPFVLVVPTMILGLWRCPRTPAGFAAMVTLVHFAFFAFNKQAFINYYYFIMASSCWAIAAAKLPWPAAAEPALSPRISR